MTVRHKVPPFRTPCRRRCAVCHEDIASGTLCWAHDDHIFNTPECVDVWEDLKVLL